MAAHLLDEPFAVAVQYLSYDAVMLFNDMPLLHFEKFVINSLVGVDEISETSTEIVEPA